MPATSLATTKLCGRQKVVFTDAQAKRISRILRYERKTFQAFAHAAVMSFVADAEELERAEQDSRTRREQPEERETIEPSGLGIGDRLAPKETDDTLSAAPAAQTVIVNTSQSSSESDVQRFARFVTSGQRWECEERLRAAVKLLKGMAANFDEREVLAKQLDEAIAAIDKKKEAPASGSMLNRLKDLIK